MKKQYRLILFAAALVAAALACGTPGDNPALVPTLVISEDPAQESEEPEEISEKVVEPQPEDSESEESSDSDDGESGSIMPGETINLDDLSTYKQPNDFNTYKATLFFDFESIDADPVVTGTVDLQSLHSGEPLEESMIVETFGKALFGDESVLSFVTVDGIQYTHTPQTGCMSGPAGGLQLNPFAVFLDDGGLLTGEVSQIGEDTIDGIPVYVYEITQENIDITDSAGSDVNELNDGKLYVAKDGAYIVRVILDGTGTSEVLSQSTTLEGNIYYQLDYYEFDEPVDVVPPPACATTEGQDDVPFPVPEDATEFEFQFGLYHFFTGLSMEETVNFYLDNMPNEGWTLVSDDTSPEFASLSFSHSDGREFAFFITPASDGTTEVTAINTNAPPPE